MAVPGPKPQPTVLKLLRGNPGKRAPNKKEPKLAAVTLKAPRHLNAEAKKEWKRVAKLLGDSGVTTDLDRAALVGYCEWWSHVVRLSADLRKVPPVIVSKKTQQPYIAPWLSALSMAMKQMNAFAGELGMTPSARSRIESIGFGDAGDDLDGFNEELERGCVG